MDLPACNRARAFILTMQQIVQRAKSIIIIRNNQLNGWQYTMNSTYINKNCKQSYIVEFQNNRTVADDKKLECCRNIFIMNEK